MIRFTGKKINHVNTLIKLFSQSDKKKNIVHMCSALMWSCMFTYAMRHMNVHICIYRYLTNWSVKETEHLLNIC